MVKVAAAKVHALNVNLTRVIGRALILQGSSGRYTLEFNGILFFGLAAPTETAAGGS